MRTWSEYAAFTLVALVLVTQAQRGECSEIRVSSMGNCRIALEDENTRVNPYDFGRNPAYLLLDYERSWKRFDFGLADESGQLKRDYDPEGITDIRATAGSRKRLGDRHVITGVIEYGRLVHEDVANSIELDQYNDPFYMTDQTTGTFAHDGPSMKVDYAIRLWKQLYIGAGLDYDLSSGLKDTYTRPEIVRDHFMANVGVIAKPSDGWTIGLLARPVRTQNRTEFDQTREGHDNLIYRRYGDGIYDVLTIGSYTAREVREGVELAAQNFYRTDRWQVGVQFGYGVEENEITYGTTRQHLRGRWQSTVYDLEFIGRYAFDEFPLTVGLSGRFMSDDGWAERPDYDDVVLYENPVTLASGGVGLTYYFEPIRLLTSVEYVANDYDIEVQDHGANAVREADIVQNIGRIGFEHVLFDLHYIRAGFEVTDYLIDRWVKQPRNTDRYRVTGGFQYRTGYWDIDFQLGYSLNKKHNWDDDREGLSGIVSLTSPLD